MILELKQFILVHPEKGEAILLSTDVLDSGEGSRGIQNLIFKIDTAMHLTKNPSKEFIVLLPKYQKDRIKNLFIDYVTQEAEHFQNGLSYNIFKRRDGKMGCVKGGFMAMNIGGYSLFFHSHDAIFQ